MRDDHGMQLIEMIIGQTAAIFACTPADVVGRSRTAHMAARHAAMWAVRQRYPSLSLACIGAAFGQRHYSTVRHAIGAADQRAQQDAQYHAQLRRLMERVDAQRPALK